MIKQLLFSLLIIVATNVNAQSQIEMVNQFFFGMKNVDTATVKNIFIKNPAFHSTSLNKNGDKEIGNGQLSDFCQVIASHKSGELDERISNVKSDEQGDVCTVSMDYEFFYKGSFSHCGVNVFHFLKDKNGWKCTGIDDTREKKRCKPTIISEAEIFLNQWHMDATNADSLAYFSKLHDRSVFIGTDSSEVWTKQQFAKFAGPYFAKGKAWDFKKVSRHMVYEAEKNIVWFDEMLATWMGPCRGSGFINVAADGKLSIMQYVLSMTVPNDKVKGVIDVVKGI